MDSDRGPDPSPEFREYCGDGRPHPRPLPDAPETPEPYVASEPLRQAVNTALFLRRPLLLEGEPGTGKTRLAHAVAYELGYPLKEIYIRSTSRAQELLWTFDAVRRLYDMQDRSRPGSACSTGGRDQALAPANYVHLGKLDEAIALAMMNIPTGGRDQALAPANYVHLGKLGEAIALAMMNIPSVVLIDEIDKADLDFPNDLLLVLDRMQFEVTEVPGWKFDALGGRTREQCKPSLPLVIITSNREKELPAPFLRRCLFFYIPFPHEKELERILQAHFQKDLTVLFTTSLKRFWELRAASRFHWQKPPSTSELLDWVSALEHAERRGALDARTLETIALDKLPHLETLFKSREDLDELRSRAHHEREVLVGASTPPRESPPPMSTIDSLLLALFHRLRQGGAPLGVGEYLLAVRTLRAGYGLDRPEHLHSTCRLLWAKSCEDQELFDLTYAELVEPRLRPRPIAPPPRSAPPTGPTPPPPPAGDTPPAPPTGDTVEDAAGLPASPQPAIVPLHTFAPASSTAPLGSSGFYQLMPRPPISRREMASLWKHLRLLRREGPQVELDAEATIDAIGRTGVFSQPLLHPARRNQLRLLLLIDRRGSMAPFHPLVEALVESIHRGGMLGHTACFYFRNVPGDHLASHPALVDRRPATDVLAAHAKGHAVLIVSDAGAARGWYSAARVAATRTFLETLAPFTHRVAWLNPLPVARWGSTSAEEIAQFVPMFSLDRKGLIATIEALRGRPLAAGKRSPYVRH